MTYPPMPIRLETERLILTPESDEDAPWLCELLNARGGHQFTINEALGRIADMKKTISETGVGALVLRSRHHGRALGYCAIIVGRGSLEEPELAYELLPNAQGNGYATEAGRVMLDAAFRTGRSRIWSAVRPWNAASLRVLDKLGFQQHHVTVDADEELIWLLRER